MKKLMVIFAALALTACGSNSNSNQTAPEATTVETKTETTEGCQTEGCEKDSTECATCTDCEKTEGEAKTAE